MSQLIIIIMATSNTIMFTFMKHPMAMGISLMLQTILGCLITNNMAYNSWMPYILFLVFLGGMLVLFIYMTSVASNELFEKINVNIMTIITIIMMMVMMVMIDPTLMSNSSDEVMSLNHLENKNTMLMLFNYPTNIMTMLSVLYLFITLIVVVKMTETHQGPLRTN